MASYTNYATCSFLMSVKNLDAALTYNQTDLAMTASKLQFFIDAQSEYIDSFLRPAGYQVPLLSPPKQIILIATCLVTESLLQHSEQIVPDGIKRQTQQAKTTLLGLQEKTISLEGYDQNPQTGIGGHTPSDPQIYVTYLQRKNWGISGI